MLCKLCNKSHGAYEEHGVRSKILKYDISNKISFQNKCYSRTKPTEN